MLRAALALAAVAGAKPRTKHGRPYPETKAECGVVMFGTGDDYIQYSARNAQRIASLAPGKNWCAAQPDLDRVPVVYFHDNVCLLYTSPSPRDRQKSRMPSSA